MKAVSNFPHSRYILPNASCISLNDARQGKKTKHESVHFRLVVSVPSCEGFVPHVY